MEDEKLAEYFTSIGIDPEAGASLTIAYRLKCKSFGRIRRTEFIDGWAGMGCAPLALHSSTCFILLPISLLA